MNQPTENKLALSISRIHSYFFSNLKSRFELSNLISRGGDFKKLTIVR